MEAVRDTVIPQKKQERGRAGKGTEGREDSNEEGKSRSNQVSIPRGRRRKINTQGKALGESWEREKKYQYQGEFTEMVYLWGGTSTR